MIEQMILAHPREDVSATSVLFTFLSLFRADPTAVMILVWPEADSPPPAPEALASLVADAQSESQLIDATLESAQVLIAPSGALLRVFRESQPAMLDELINFVAGMPVDVARIEELASLRFERDVLHRAADQILAVDLRRRGAA